MTLKIKNVKNGKLAKRAEMIKNDEFSSTHGLRFEMNRHSSIATIHQFRVGGVGGYYFHSSVVIDIIFDSIETPEHLTDVFEWFLSMAKKSKSYGLRVLACHDIKLRERLVSEFGFQRAMPNSKDGTFAKML